MTGRDEQANSVARLSRTSSGDVTAELWMGFLLFRVQGFLGGCRGLGAVIAVIAWVPLGFQVGV